MRLLSLEVLFLPFAFLSLPLPHLGSLEVRCVFEENGTTSFHFLTKRAGKAFKTPDLCFVLFCPHQTACSLRKTPSGSGQGRWRPSGPASPGLPATLAFSNMAKNFCLLRGNMHISSVLRNERPFPKRGRLSLRRDLPGAACCPCLVGTSAAPRHCEPFVLVGR